MLYLLDANVLISSANGLFQIERVPQFWSWLEEMGRAGHIAIPEEIWEEIKDGMDQLAEWARADEVKDALLFDEEADPGVVGVVVSQGYAPDLTDTELVELGRDPFLIAYAYVAPEARTVVSGEVSSPGRRRGRRKVPDVCRDLGIDYLDLVGLINVLDFRI